MTEAEAEHYEKYNERLAAILSASHYRRDSRENDILFRWGGPERVELLETIIRYSRYKQFRRKLYGGWFKSYYYDIRRPLEPGTYVDFKDATGQPVVGRIASDQVEEYPEAGLIRHMIKMSPASVVVATFDLNGHEQAALRMETRVQQLLDNPDFAEFESELWSYKKWMARQRRDIDYKEFKSSIIAPFRAVVQGTENLAALTNPYQNPTTQKLSVMSQQRKNLDGKEMETSALSPTARKRKRKLTQKRRSWIAYDAAMRYQRRLRRQRAKDRKKRAQRKDRKNRAQRKDRKKRALREERDKLKTLYFSTEVAVPMWGKSSKKAMSAKGDKKTAEAVAGVLGEPTPTKATCGDFSQFNGLQPPAELSDCKDKTDPITLDDWTADNYAQAVLSPDGYCYAPQGLAQVRVIDGECKSPITRQNLFP